MKLIRNHRFLKNYPLLRLVFVLYLLMLHLWALIILVVHLHSIKIDEDVGNAVIAGASLTRNNS